VAAIVITRPGRQES